MLSAGIELLLCFIVAQIFHTRGEERSRFLGRASRRPGEAITTSVPTIASRKIKGVIASKPALHTEDVYTVCPGRRRDSLGVSQSSVGIVKRVLDEPDGEVDISRLIFANKKGIRRVCAVD